MRPLSRIDCSLWSLVCPDQPNIASWTRYSSSTRNEVLVQEDTCGSRDLWEEYIYIENSGEVLGVRVRLESGDEVSNKDSNTACSSLPAPVQSHTLPSLLLSSRDS